MPENHKKSNKNRFFAKKGRSKRALEPCLELLQLQARFNRPQMVAWGALPGRPGKPLATNVTPKIDQQSDFC